MRNLITDYEYIPGTRTITLPKFANLAEGNPFGVENIRLIVNETQKVVICSSMQKDNVTVDGNKITYTEALAPLAFGDKLTIEVDMGDDIVYVDSGDWVINAKLDALKPIEQQKEWVLDKAKAMQLKPIVESGGSSVIASFFQKTAVKSLNLSSWEKIDGDYTCYLSFANSDYLENVDLQGLEAIRGTMAASRMFENCRGLLSVSLGSIKRIEGTSSAERIFQNCSSLRELSMPHLELIAGQSAFNSALSGCSSLRELSMPMLREINGYAVFTGQTNYLYKIDFRALEKVTGQNVALNAGFSGVKVLRIGSKALKNTSVADAIINTMTALTDLYLYGVPENNIYLSWQGSLNFNSVCGVLKKLCDNTNANGLECAFKSGFTIDDKPEWNWTDGDGNTEAMSNPNGILKALREQATSQGWTIKNLTING